MNFKESKLSKSLQFIDSHLNFSPLGRWHEEKTRRKLVQDSNPMSNPATVSTEQPPEKCPSPKGLIRLKETKFIDVHDVLERKKKDRQSLSNQKNASFLPSYFIPVATSSVKEVLHITVVDTLWNCSILVPVSIPYNKLDIRTDPRISKSFSISRVRCITNGNDLFFKLS